MADVTLNMFDLGVLVIVGLSALMAFFRGFVREFLSLVGWLGASIITLRALPTVSKMLEPHIASPVIANGIASVLLFFGCVLVFSIISGFIIKVLKPGAKVGLFDNLLGLCFGSARGILMIAIGYHVMTAVLAEKDYPEMIKDSYAAPYIARVAKWVGTLTPEALKAITEKKAFDADTLKNAGDSIKSSLEKLPGDLPSDDDITPDTPSIEELQQRLREENLR